MRIILINTFCGFRSTGRICTDYAEKMSAEGNIVKIAYGRGPVEEKFEKYAVKIGGDMDVYCHAANARLLDNTGFASRKATARFLKWVDDFNPDFIWLHNLHGYYINIELLFKWIHKHPEKKYKWTLHDCWAVTGHCAHFVTTRCEKWKCKCYSCPELDAYPKTFCPWNVEKNYNKKKTLFTGVSDMTIVTPSNWLKGIVEESYLKDYPIEVLPTQLDTSIFRPADTKDIEAIRDQYKIGDKKLILGAASDWTEKKGLYDFIRLSEKLSDVDPGRYVIVLVGLDDKQMKMMSEYSHKSDDKDLSKVEIIGIRRTANRQQMALLYSAADVFVNMTYEDTLPTVNLEAEACGTRVITYDVGGCQETIKRSDSKCVRTGDLEAVIKELR